MLGYPSPQKRWYPKLIKKDVGQVKLLHLLQMGLHANVFSLDASVKIFGFKKAENNTKSINIWASGYLDYARWAVWNPFLFSFLCQGPHLLPLFRKLLQHLFCCEAPEWMTLFWIKR